MARIPVLLRPLAAALLACLPALAAAAEIPPVLEPWRAWVLAGHPEVRCPVVDGTAACVWPGDLQVQAFEEGGRFTYGVTVDRRLGLPLPGGPGAWPQEVRVDGRAAAVLAESDVPYVLLEPGSHTLAGSFRWARLPQVLRVPPPTGRVVLSVDGEAVAWPHLDAEGNLRLGAGDVAGGSEDRLDLEVSRRVQDGVPVRVETRVRVRAAGRGREVDLGMVLVPRTKPVSLTADLPARFTTDNHLVIQVRPGTFTATFDALHEGPAASLAAPSPGGAWPAHEYWAVATDDRARSVDLSGPPAVDPGRTTLPEEWRSLPAFQLGPDTPLAFAEQRRGEPEPAPNRLALERTMWLDVDGGGLTVRDRFTGTMTRDWRLEMRSPGELGHVVADGRDQVITRGPSGLSGVALRSSTVDVVAESRIPGRPWRFDAVGWDTDVHDLDASVHLPPGWTVFAGSGVDDLPGSLLDDWSLFDLFFVLLLSMASARLLGWPWGAVALVGLTLSRQQPGAPAWAWVWPLVLLWLLGVLRPAWIRGTAQVLRWLAIASLLAILAVFSYQQLRVGLFPVLEQPWNVAGQLVPDRFVELEQAQMKAEEAVLDKGVARGRLAEPLLPPTASDLTLQSRKAAPSKAYLSLQYDPSSVVNTGPGLQEWSWRPVRLTWSGPVTRDHRATLVLFGPRLNLLLAILRVGLLVALGLRLAGVRRIRLRRHGASIAAVAGVAAILTWPATALAGRPGDIPQAPDRPSPPAAPATPSLSHDGSLLAELEARLTRPPECAPRCAEAAQAHFSVAADRLRLEAEVHAGALTSWPLPGPAATWVPASVSVDGTRTTALARLGDGFLHVRLPPGVHRVRAEGPLPPVDSLTLTLPAPPRRATFTGDGWTLDGFREDGTPERTIQVTRTLASPTTGTSSAENLAPWVEVHRFLDLGIPWRARTEVVRVGPASTPLSLKVPVLPGEAVTDASLRVEDGAVRVSLDRDRTSVSWLSTLSTVPELVLAAPVGVPWTEEWTLSCSPVFDCRTTGIAPLQHVRDGTWSPRWRPWPGERVVLEVSRPEGVAGQTSTVDRVRLEVTPGRRLSEATLAFDVRTTRAGQQVLGLPEGARLQRVAIQGEERPIQAQDGRLPIPLQPGTQTVEVAWQQPHDPAFWDRVPAVDLGGPAVNATVVVHAPPERWILFLTGPRWGPVTLFWSFVLVIVGAAVLLGRSSWAPLKTWQWALLGLGMTQVPVVAPLVVAAWFLTLGVRARRPARAWWVFDLAQAGLLLLTLAAFAALYAAIHTGLLFRPDMQIEGNGSTATELVWFADRVDGLLPRPAVLSLPLWTWRVSMLLWSLWLAVSLLGWLPWAWRAFTTDGAWRPPPRATQPAPAGPIEALASPPPGTASPPDRPTPSDPSGAG
ncbi:MAG: hypothetical protein JXB39_10920 [Deltaproteobacteria bacterium]|nr:hypothetical protein [Deltaproteobacteria bacterium]